MCPAGMGKKGRDYGLYPGVSGVLPPLMLGIQKAKITVYF